MTPHKQHKTPKDTTLTLPEASHQVAWSPEDTTPTTPYLWKNHTYNTRNYDAGDTRGHQTNNIKHQRTPHLQHQTQDTIISAQLLNQFKYFTPKTRL